MKRYSKSKKSFPAYEASVLLIVIYYIVKHKISVNMAGLEGVLTNKMLNYILIFVVFVLGIKILIKIIKGIRLKYKQYMKNKQYLHSKIHEIDRMSGIEFEEFLKAHFTKKGYRVNLTPASNDYGADLVLNKFNEKIVVQAKRYGSKVGNDAVREVLGAIGFYKATKGIVITNSYFTSNAIKLAKANNIQLWDRSFLIKEFVQ